MAREMDIQNKRKFEFTRKWFLNRNLSTFREHIYPVWKDKPITYLEIGVFEGMSLVWMLQYVLTHPDARAVAIDPWLMTTKLDEEFMQGVMERAKKNLQPYRKKVKIQRGNSAEVLRKMVHRKGYLDIGRESVDLCMIDGDHNQLAVLDDLRLVYRLMKPGGWIILDDVENQIQKHDHVKEGLAMFLEEQPMEQVFKHRFVEVYRK